MRISWSLSGMLNGVKLPYEIGSPEFDMDIIGKEIWVVGSRVRGRITGYDVESNRLFGVIDGDNFDNRIVSSKGLGLCLFTVEESED